MARSGQQGTAENLRSPHVRVYLTRRQDIETSTPGVSMIQRILPGSDVVVAANTGADVGTGEVTLALSETGVIPGQFNTFVVDKNGRIVKAWNESSSGGGSGGGGGNGILNQMNYAQNASFWIYGPARIDGNLAVGSLTAGVITATSLSLASPLSTTYGGTGVTTALANYVLAGPVSGPAASPSWRQLAVGDLPNIPWPKIVNAPVTVAGYGIVDVYTRSEADVKFIASGAGSGSGTTSAVSIADWQPYKLYTDQVVTYQLALFKCVTVHTSGPVFDTNFWHEFVGGVSEHSQLTNLNDNPAMQHVSTADIARWNGLQAQIDALKAGAGAGSSIVLVNDAVLNGTAVDFHSVSQARFLISGAAPTDTVTLNDISKVSTVPAGLRGAVIVQQITGAWYLIVNLISMTYGSSYSVGVGAGCVLVNGSDLNTNSLTCAFTTTTAPSQPIVGQSTTNGTFGVNPATLSSVVFPVTVSSGNLDLQMASSSAWSCVPTNIVVGVPVLDNTAKTITFNLAGALSDTQYTLSVNAGLVSNSAGGATNAGTVAAVFGTTLSVPVVGASPDNGSTTVDVSASGRYVSFPLSTASTRGTFDIAALNKITVIGGTSGGASIVGNNLRVYYSGGIDGDTVTFNIDAGAIKNFNSLGDVVVSTGTQTASITYAVRAPVLTAPATIAGNNDVDATTSTILVPYTSAVAVTLDGTKVSSVPAGIVTASALTTVGVTTYVALTLSALTQNQNVSITLASGVVKALNVTPNAAALTFSFRVKASEPVIAQSPLNGTSVGAGSVSSVTFAVTGTDTLALADASKVTISPSAGGATATFSGGVLTLPITPAANTNYTVTVAAGALKNRNTVNSTAVICNFATATAFSVSQSPINGTRVPATTASVTFALANVNGTAVIADAAKITGANCTVGTPTISGNNLVVPISGLGFSSTASVVVQAGALHDAILASSNTVTCAFTTAGSVPVVGTGTLDGQTTVATSTAYVDFPVTASGTVGVANASLVTSIPAGLVSSSTITGSIGSYKLRVNLSTMAANTNYTINVAAGAVTNDGTVSTAAQSCAFKTVDSAPVIGQSPINTTYNAAAGLTTVTWPITSSSQCVIANAAKITVSGGPAISNTTVTGSDIVVTLTGVAVNQTMVFSILSGLVANGDGITSTNAVATTVYTKGDAPVITQSPAQGSSNLAVSPAYIEYNVTASGPVTIANANLVTVTPNHLQSVSMVAGKLRVTINFANSTAYTVNVAAGVLVNTQTLSTTTLTTTFTTALPVPVVGQSPTNGTTQPTSFTTMDFPVTNPGTLTVANAAVVTATNATVSGVAISGSNVRVTLSGLTNSKSVAVTVGVGAISNGSATNTAAQTSTFTTAGAVPVVGQSTVNGTTPARTITTVDFPITNASGTLTVANASLVHATAGFDAIISGVAINSTNLRVTLNGSLVFNKAYSISVDAGAVANDGVASTNAVVCAFTTLADVPVVGQSSVNGIRQPIANQTLSFPITVGAVAGTLAVANAALVTVTGGTKGTVSISGSNLLVPVTGMTNSATVTVTVAAGAVSNSGVTNTAARTCTFTTVGALVTIAQASANGTTPAAGALNVDFPLSATSFGTLSVDALKVTSVPSAIASTPTIVNVSGTNYLRVPMTLAGATAYTINVAAGAVTNDTTASTSVVACTFTSAAGGAARPILWSYQFTLPIVQGSINLMVQPGWGSNVLTSADIYGPAFDGTGAMAELRWYGYVGNIIHPDGVVVPRDGIDFYTPPNPDLAYAYDDSTGGAWIYFNSGSTSNKIYRVIKYSA